MRKKTKSVSNILNFEQSLEQSKKKFSVFDLYAINPLTDNQELAFNAWKEGKNLFLGGSAGTGKSLLALYFALDYVLDHTTPCKNIVIIRSIVPSRDIGYLPGEEDEKIAPYESPYRLLCDQLFKWKNSYENLKRAGIIKFEPTSFLRGMTLDESVVIMEESENYNWSETITTCSRIGMDSRVIINGDAKQTDLHKHNDTTGFYKLLDVTRLMPNFEHIMFTREDIVRSGFVKDFIIACEDLNL